MKLRLTFLPLFVVWLAAGAAFAQPTRVVRIGVLAYRGPDEVVAHWGQLPDRLAKAVPGYRFELHPLEGPALRQAVRRNDVEFVLTNSTQYVALAAEFGIRRIATVVLPEATSPEQALGSTIVTLAGNTTINELADLRGLRIAAAADDAFGGYLAGARELLKAGVDIDGGDARLVLTGVPMRSALEALKRGDADAAIVRTCLLEQVSRKGRISITDFRVLAPRPQPGFACMTSTPLYPDWPFAATSTVDRELARAVTVALLSLPPSEDGVAWDVPADYQSVHELFQELMIGPYAHLRTSTIEGLAKRYRTTILVVLALLAGIVVHVVRVEYLVSRRTAELRAAQARAQELQRDSEHMARLSILGEMSGTLAHELNQPLTTIATYAQGLERHCAAGEINCELVAHANREIVAQTERASGVIRRVRAFARKRIATRESKPLAETVREAVGMFSAMLPELPPVLIDNRLPANTTVEADHLQLQQVLLNLLKNAADASSELPWERRVITVVIARRDGALAIDVADRGPGVSAETLARLFDPFFTTKPDGLGLGLAICKSIIEAHGGHLSAQPREPSPGLVFHFTLPDGAA